jgi:Transposase DDE domain group 1
LLQGIHHQFSSTRGSLQKSRTHGYTRTYGYHPIIAIRSDTGEVLHIRNRKGQANTQRGAERFVDELLARVRRTGHHGLIVLRADSGFENHKLMPTLDQQGVEFSIGIKQSKQVGALIAEIPEENWVPVPDYPETGEAQIAETKLGAFWLIVRRTRLVGAQAELWPDWRHHTFATNRTIPPLVADTDHRDHAGIELTIRDLKDQALAHFPSGRYHANSAWTVIAAIAHNLARWTTLIGLPNRPVQTATARRRRLLQLPGRLTRTSRQWTLRLPARWPWKTDFTTVLDAIRALPART